MGLSPALLLAAVAVAVLSVLPSLVIQADAKFSFSGLASDLISPGQSRKSRLLAAQPVYRAQTTASHGPDQIAHAVAPSPSGGDHPPGAGHHPPGSGHHPPGAGHHPPGAGHHPPNAFGVVPGHHTGGGGHHATGGHHPTKGHHCNKVQGLCLTPYYASLKETTCCSKTCVNLQADTTHCGTCTNVCPGSDFCCLGACADLQSDAGNCGACGRVCPGRSACVMGICTSYGHAPAPAPAA